MYVEYILLGYYTPNGVCLIYCLMFHSYFTFRKYINTSASFQSLDTPLKYLNTPFLAHSTQFNGDMLNCRLKGSLVLVCLACIWRSNDHYGKVRYYLSQVNLSSYNFYDFFLLSFFFWIFLTLFLYFILKYKDIHFMSNSHGNTIIWQFVKLWLLDWLNGLSRRLVCIIFI